mgnify:CR=1 FL=1
MNIHEYQAKEILKKFGINIPNGFVIFSPSEIEEKFRKLKTKKNVLKAQIHAGGRGKAGGIKIVSDINELKKEAKNLFGKKLVTPQTGAKGKNVKTLYVEETCNVDKEFYLSCLIDRSSSKIAFISSSEGGMDIEKVARDNPELIFKAYIDPTIGMMPYISRSIAIALKLDNSLFNPFSKLLQAMYSLFLNLDTSLIEINPLAITKKQEFIALDAKIEIEEDALFRHPDVIKLKDDSQVDPLELKAENAGVNYVKLDGDIGCLVNGAGLAMATMDIIKLYGSEPANFLDVGGGASKEKVSAAFKIILSDKNVKGILINIFGGIMRCDVLAQGVVEAAKESNLKLPLVVRLAGTNVELGKEILKKSKLKIISADNLSDAAKKIVEVTK